MIEAWLTLGVFVVITLILGHAILFEMLPEPVQGWECTVCHKKVIGMKSQVEEAAWNTEDPCHCPGCKITN